MTLQPESKRAAKRRTRKFVAGIGWVKPKVGYCWTFRGDQVRSTNLPVWGSRKYGEMTTAELGDWY